MSEVQHAERVCSNCGERACALDVLDQEGEAYVTCRACAAEGDHIDDLVDQYMEDYRESA